MGERSRRFCSREGYYRKSCTYDRFRCFRRTGTGVDALLHVSQISKAHVDKPSDVLSIGQEITAKIVDLNEAEKKISLSMKALENENQAEEDSEE